MHFNCEYILQSIQSQDSDVAFTVKLKINAEKKLHYKQV